MLEDGGRELTSSTIQGYCLLDLAVEQRTLELTETKPQDHVGRVSPLFLIHR